MADGFYEFKKEQVDKKNSESDTEIKEDIKNKKK